MQRVRLSRSAVGPPRSGLFVILFVCLALVVAACGDGTTTETTTAGDPGTTAVEDPGTTQVDPESPESSEPTGDPVLVGITAPLSGPGASFGEALTRGAQSWEHHVNTSEGVGGRPVELRICDDEGTPDGAVACGRQFIDDEIQAVMTFTFTGVVRALHGVLDDVLVVNSSPNVRPEAGTTFFQSVPTVEQTLVAIMEFAVDQGYSTIGLLAATDASGEEAAGAFDEVVAEYDSLELVVTRLDPEDVQASAQMSRLVSEGAELLAISYSGAGAVTAVRAYANLGLDIPIVLNSANVTDDFVALLGDEVPAALYGAPTAVIDAETAPDPFRTRILEYQEEYEAVHGMEPDSLAGTGRYTADIVGAALEAAGPDATGAEMAEWLSQSTVESLTDISYGEMDLNVPVGFDLRLVLWVDDTWSPVPAD